ncbi:Anthranilate phosphoribosyltransferase [Carnimonas sp. R-84981]|uniref:anthranilate phosphoribosyltransferase n=1 Tax=Carnimonas bestiolae TaxID=3402172 RepID=UPI003EDC60B5
MIIREALARLTSGQSLDFATMHQVMQQLMAGELGDAQIGALLAALATKGETSAEISAAAQAMRDVMQPVSIAAAQAVDIVGTGGDGANLFNVSTAAAFVTSAAGVPVAKHGNRSVSSSSGSADLLEKAGINLALSAEQVARCIDEVGIGFMFAPNHHQAMRHAAQPRRELGIKTLFNILGPLTNPAGVQHQVIGVYSPHLLNVVAEAFQQLGSQHALVVTGDDGLDEFSIAVPSQVCELRQGELRSYSVAPEQLGLKRASLDCLRVENTEQSLARVMSALRNEAGAARDMVALNAGAAIYAADRAATLEEGVTLALEVMASGKAVARLEELGDFTRSLS